MTDTGKVEKLGSMERSENFFSYSTFFIVVLVGFFIESLMNFAYNDVIMTATSSGYIFSAKIPLLDNGIEFFTGGVHSIGVPLIYKLVGSDITGIQLIQYLLYVGSWAYFAWVSFNYFNKKLVGFVLSLGIFWLALTPLVNLWNNHVLSESIAFSSCVLIFSFFIQWQKTSNVKYLVLLSVATVIFATTRDVNSYFVFALIPLLFMFWMEKRLNFFCLVFFTVIFSGLFVWTNWSANQVDKYVDVPTQRWIYPYMNVMTNRMLANDNMYRYFVDHGMPENDKLKQYEGGLDQSIMLNDKDMGDFVQWVVNNGQATYMRYLISHPKYTLGALIKDRNLIYNMGHENPLIRNYSTPNYTSNKLTNIGASNNKTVYIALGALMLFVLIINFMKNQRISKNTLYALYLMLMIAIPFAAAYYHSEVDGITRHCLLISLMLKISLLFVIASGIGDLMRINEKINSSQKQAI